MLPKFKTIVHRGSTDKYAAIMADGSLQETAINFSSRRAFWRELATGDMVRPILSLSAHAERLIAVDAKGQAWRQANDGTAATRGTYNWHRIEFEFGE